MGWKNLPLNHPRVQFFFFFSVTGWNPGQCTIHTVRLQGASANQTMSILNLAAQGACVCPVLRTEYAVPARTFFLLVEQTAGLVGATAKSESWWRVDGLEESSCVGVDCPCED